jgi:hypothetical protein
VSEAAIEAFGIAAGLPCVPLAGRCRLVTSSPALRAASGSSGAIVRRLRFSASFFFSEFRRLNRERSV